METSNFELFFKKKMEDLDKTEKRKIRKLVEELTTNIGMLFTHVFDS